MYDGMIIFDISVIYQRLGDLYNKSKVYYISKEELDNKQSDSLKFSYDYRYSTGTLNFIMWTIFT